MYGSEIIHPYATAELVKVVVGSSIRLGKRLRPLFVEYLDPTLATFLNMASDGDRHRRISQWVISQMVSDYKGSWYGQKIARLARPEYRTTEFQDFWYHWTLASFCEELRRQGVEIR